MGYKRLGCEVVAANDIDPEMAYHYKLNLRPKHYFLCPIKDLLTIDLPDELYDLDILDGSPPCSSFSVSGNREKDWGKKKHFREGQAEQVLDDLFFDYIALVDRIRPKVSIAENVKGMILGGARGYLKMIFAAYRQIGYTPQLFLINAANCGVPQSRERVFFCAVRNDVSDRLLVLNPQEKVVTAEDAISDLVLSDSDRQFTMPNKTDVEFWPHTAYGKDYSEACINLRGKSSFFNHVKLHPRKPASTLTSKRNSFTHWNEMRLFSLAEWKRFGSFPDDYQCRNDKIGTYLIGMSVPPKMTEQVAKAAIEQWIQREQKP